MHVLLQLLVYKRLSKPDYILVYRAICKKQIPAHVCANLGTTQFTTQTHIARPFQFRQTWNKHVVPPALPCTLTLTPRALCMRWPFSVQYGSHTKPYTWWLLLSCLCQRGTRNKHARNKSTSHGPCINHNLLQNPQPKIMHFLTNWRSTASNLTESNAPNLILPRLINIRIFPGALIHTCAYLPLRLSLTAFA